MAGGKIDILVEPDLKGFTRKVDTGLKGALTKIAGIGAGIAGAAGISALGADVIKTGVEVQKLANQFQGVTGATSEQMESVNAKAHELGKATDIIGASSADAMQAMKDLAKAGFDVDQAMGSAKGTLQLASAAQLDAGQAAEITARQINTFKLKAEDAGRVADVLAGAANNAAGDIPTMALGLSQAGTMASMFNISMEDTVTALSMFANNGVQGSDAGTMLKTMLTQLVNPSKDAKQAIEEMGLTTHDAEGKFVGLESIMGQLHGAYERMSDQDFGRNAAKIFGTDAVRFAGIAAKSTTEEWDKLSSAITRQGNAAKLAEAQTKGLPGVLERLENTTDDVKLNVYEKLAPTLAQWGTALANSVDSAAPAIEGLADNAVTVAGAVGKAFSELTLMGGQVASAIAPVAGTLTNLAGAAVNAAGGLDAIATPAAALGISYMVSKYAGLAGTLQRSARAAKGFNDSIKVQKWLAERAGKSLGTLGAAWAQMESRSPVMNRASDGYRAGSKHMKVWAAQARKAAESTKGLTRVMNAGASRAAGFGNMLAGVGRAGGSLAKSGMGGLINFLGGPWVVGITAAVAVVMGLVDAIAHVKEAHKGVAKTAHMVKDAQDGVTDALQTTSGEMTGDAVEASATLAKSYMNTFESLAKGSTLFSRIMVGTGASAETIGKEFENSAQGMNFAHEAMEKLQDTLGKMGYDLEDVYKIVGSGGPEFDKLVKSLTEQGYAGKSAAAELQRVRTETQGYIDAARKADPAYGRIKDAIDKLADSAASAEDKVSAMNQLFEDMGMIDTSAGDALAQVEQHIDDIADSAQNLADKGPIGDALWGKDGHLNLDNGAARDMREQIKQLGKDYETLLVSGGDPGQALEGYERGLNAVAGAYQTDIDRVKSEAESLVGVQETIERHAKLDGAEKLEQGISSVADELARVKDTPLSIDKPDPEVIAAFDELGVKLKDIGNDHVEIPPVPPETRKSVEDFANAIADVRRNSDVNVEAHISTEKLKFDSDEVKTLVKDLDTQSASPSVKLILDKFKDGSSLTQTELLYLSSLSADPKAFLDNAKALGDIQHTKDKVKELDGVTGTATADVNTAPAESKLSALWGKLKSIGSWFSGHSSGGAAAGSQRADGAYTPAADGLLSQQQAQMARGGSYLLWAEDETQGESFIPHAQSKRARSTEILRKTAELFGLGLVDRAGHPIVSNGRSTHAPATHRFADGGLRSFLAGRQLSAGGATIGAVDMLGIVGQHIQAVQTMKQAEDELASTRETFAREDDELKAAEDALAKAREDSHGDATKVADAEKNLAEARKKVDSQASRAAQAQRRYIAGYITAAGQAIQQVVSAAAGVADLLASRFSTMSDFFKGMASAAESVERLKQTVVDLAMDQVRLRMKAMTSLQDLRMAEISVARARAEGIGSVADAEAHLAEVREQQRRAGLTSIEAMNGALDRFRKTGVFSVEMVTQAMEGATAAEREAIAGVAVAKANAALKELDAAKARELAALDYQTAIFNQQASIAELRITTEALRQQSKLLGDMTTQQAKGAAAALDGKAQQSQGSSKILGGVGKTLVGAGAGAAAGFAVFGPLGALIGAGLGALAGGLSSAKDFQEGAADIAKGKFKESRNKRDLDEALKAMTPAQRERYLREGSLVGGDNIRVELEKSQREMEARLAAHKQEVASKRLALEGQRLGVDSGYNAREAKLQAELDYYKAQQKLATATTPEQVAAYKEMGEIALQMRDASVEMSTQLRDQNAQLIVELRKMVAATEATARASNTQVKHIEVALPPGEAFTREQFKSGMRELAEAADVRLTELENKQEVHGADYLRSRV